MALRTRCSSGSRRWSMTVLSSSVSPPSATKRTSLPRRAARSRTSRRKAWKVASSGTMRTDMVLSRNDSVSRSSPSASSRRRGSSWSVAMRERRDCRMTSSPTLSSRRSTLALSTRRLVVGPSSPPGRRAPTGVASSPRAGAHSTAGRPGAVACRDPGRTGPVAGMEAMEAMETSSATARNASPPAPAAASSPAASATPPCAAMRHNNSAGGSSRSSPSTITSSPPSSISVAKGSRTMTAGCSVTSTASQRRWTDSASSPSRSGTVSQWGQRCSAPRARKPSSRREGSSPRRSASADGA